MPLPVTVRPPLLPVVFSTMPLVAPFAEMLRNSRLFAPMVVFATLSATGQVEEKEAEAPTPAVPVKRSVGTDYIVCLEDGKKLKMLKRHLATRYNMTPDDYRRRWGLPANYPMVAPAYAEQRSSLAKKIGLGRKPAATPAAVAPEPTPAPGKRPLRVGGRRKSA